jgi:hypothetical protein
VTRPYPTAASAQMSATTTPWSDRKSDKGYLSGSVQGKHGKRRPERAAAVAARKSIDRCGDGQAQAPWGSHIRRVLCLAGPVRRLA